MICYVVEGLVVDCFRCENCEVVGYYGGNVVGYCKVVIVCFCGYQQGKCVIVVDCVLVKSVCFVVGDWQVIVFWYKLICQFYGCDVFWVVVGLIEGD